MVDVNTVIGAPVETKSGGTIIPVSKVSFGFAAGGGEYGQKESTTEDGESALPFGGGSGAGVSVQPVGFLVLHQDEVRLLPIGSNPAFDRLMDQAPDLIDRIGGVVRGQGTRDLTSRSYGSDYPE